MMRFASGGNIGLNAQLLTILNIGFREVTVVHGHRCGSPDFSGHRFQGRQSFPFIVGMIREGMRHDQQTLLIGSHLHILVLVKAIIGAVLHDARIRIGEVVLILIPWTGFGWLGWASFWFVMPLASLLGTFFHFGVILRFFRK